MRVCPAAAQAWKHDTFVFEHSNKTKIILEDVLSEMERELPKAVEALWRGTPGMEKCQKPKRDGCCQE